MTISQERVVDYLDDQVVDVIETVSEQGIEFNVSLNVGGMGAHIIRERDDGPLIVVGVIRLEGEHLELFMDLSENQRMNYLSQIGAVLTNSPGLYRFTDGEGNDVDYGRLEAVRVEDRIYPDGFSQDRLMNSVYDLIQSLYYVKTMTNVFMSNIQGQR
ncbi:MAG: DUF2299 family protein [Halobacteria archaeon]